MNQLSGAVFRNFRLEIGEGVAGEGRTFIINLIARFSLTSQFLQEDEVIKRVKRLIDFFVFELCSF